jgi:basic membrane lipoprotein Med (substrate-binding protein (PBP1-ABC) superfamily)/ABC-type branched-subunit amino acid transport system substrate-binding protein
MKTNFVLRWSALLLALIFAVSLAGPASAECTDCVTLASTDPIHIAYLLTLSGGTSGLGLEQQRGIELAFDDLGGKILGHDILVDGEDGACSEAGGSTAAQLLAGDSSILAVVGTTCSVEAIGAMPFLFDAGFSVVSPSNTLPSLTESSDPHFDLYLRVAWNDRLQAETAAQYAYTELSLTTAATIADDGQPYSEALAQVFADKFATLGGTITSQQTIDPGDTSDIDAKLATIAAGTPAVLYMPVFMPEGGYIMDHLPAGLAGVQLMASDGLWDSGVNAAANEEGLLLTNYDFTATHNSDFVTKFLPAYRTKYGADPSNPFHAHAYDAFMLIKEAIESVAIDLGEGAHAISRQALRDALYAISGYKGLTGTLTCDANGDCADPSMAVYQFHADEFPPEYLAPDKIGLVMTGLGDMSFNDQTYQGLLQAETDFDIAKTLYLPSGPDDYESSLQQCVNEGNGLCIAVGFSMFDAVNTVANANPDTKFAILDASPESPPSNLRGIIFNAKQVGYLAGALAGKMSTSNVIGAVGGTEITPVINYLEGYQNGAQCASDNINVLMNYTGTFSDPDLGENTAADMISRGADIIFAAAGPTGNGAILYSAQHDVWSIGVDADQYLTLFEGGTVDGADMLLTSAMKRLDKATYETIKDYLDDTFTSGTVTYGLADDGVGLASYHETDTSIPQATKDYIDAVKSGILAGTINVDYACESRFHAQIVENDVQGYDWLKGTTVTLKVDTPPTGTGWDYTTTQTVDDYGTVVFNTSDPNLATMELVAGTEIWMDDGLIPQPKTHTVTDLVVTGVDPETDTVWGTAAYGTGTPERRINVQYCDDSGCSWRRWVTVQSDSTWLADFTALGTPDDIGDSLDIIPGMTGEALESDDDNDITDYQWYVPNPQITSNPLSNWVQARERLWNLNDEVTLEIDDPATPENPDVGPKVAYVEVPLDSSDLVAIFDDLEGYDLKPGDLVTVSGGVGLAGPITKTMTVLETQVLSFDLAADTVSGQSEASAPVDVCVNVPGGCEVRHVTANGSGVWLADFSEAGTEPDEGGTVDLISGSDGWAQEKSPEDDYTFIDWVIVSISGNTGAPNVTLNYTGGSTTSGSSGDYLIGVPSGWSGTVTPVKPSHTFQPSGIPYSNLTGDETEQNYTASLLVNSSSSYDGWVLESSETSGKGGSMSATATTLRVGDDLGRKQYRSILSFATGSGLPDNAVITKITLKLRRQGVTGGGNPITAFQGFMVDIKKGYFGTTALQTADFQTAGSKTYGAFKPALSSSWYSINLTSGQSYINKLSSSSGLTQIRLRFKLDDNNNTTANYLSLYSGNASSSYRPQLIIEYHMPLP